MALVITDIFFTLGQKWHLGINFACKNEYKNKNIVLLQQLELRKSFTRLVK